MLLSDVKGPMGIIPDRDGIVKGTVLRVMIPGIHASDYSRCSFSQIPTLDSMFSPDFSGVDAPPRQALISS